MQWALIPLTAAMVITPLARSQTVQPSSGESGRITGTVTDVRGDAVFGATVVLTGPGPTDQKTITTGDNGYFAFDDVKPGVSYQVMIKASGFADWTSPAISLEPGGVKSLGETRLSLASQNTAVTVTFDPVEIATEQTKVEETQRIFGILPNFYVSYEGDNAAPLTTKMKFQLALKVSYDPVTIAGVGFIAGLRQAARES